MKCSIQTMSNTVLAGSIGVLLLASCARENPEVRVDAKSETLPTGWVAQIGDTIILAETLQAEADRRMRQGRPVPSAEILLEEFLRVQAMLMEAQSQGLDEDADVQAEFERLLVRTFRSRTLTRKLDDVLVSEEEMSSAYQARIADFTQPGTDRFAMLYLKKEPGRLTASVDRMEKARAEILKTIEDGVNVTGFGALAISCSDDQASRYRGGDVGWVRQAQDSPRLPSVVLDSARKLNLGEMTPVLESESGHFVVMKTDTRPSRVTPFAEVRTHLHRRLLSEKKKDMEEAFYTTYLKKADPKINAEGLAGLTLERADDQGQGTPSDPSLVSFQPHRNLTP